MENENKKAAPARAQKSLQATAASGAYQKKWFADLSQRVKDGEDFAYLNADVPMEILRAMDGKYAFVFLTLTVKNCTGTELSGTLDLLMDAWQRLSQRKQFLEQFYLLSTR